MACHPLSPSDGDAPCRLNPSGRPTSWTSIFFAIGLMLWPVAAWGAASPSSPGDSADAPFGGRRGEVNPEGTAILNVDSGMTFADLQAAIDAASPGDTLQVQTAVHPEGQVQVSTSVILEGQTGTETVQMSVDTGNSGDDRAWFLVDAGVDLTVRNLTFDGDGRLIWQAFRHRGTGSFDNVTFNDIRFDDGMQSFQGTAIVAFGGNVDVTGCTFTNIGRIGTLFFGTGITLGSFDDNVYVGKGDGSHLDYGLEVGAGALVLAANNQIRDNNGIAPDNSASAGVLATTFFGAGTTLDLQLNDLGDNLFSLLVGFDGTDTSTVQAFFNRLASNGTAAIDHQSSNPLPAERNWWGCNGGPTDPDCDSIMGSGVVTFDPWVVLDGAIDPVQVLAGEDASLQGLLLEDSNGDPMPNSLGDGVVVTFDGGPLGTVDPSMAGTVAGVAETTWTAGDTQGIDIATVSLDAESIDVPVEVLPSIVIEVPTLGARGLSVLSLLLVTLGVVVLRRRA